MPIAHKAFFASLLLPLFMAQPLWAAEDEEDVPADEEPGKTEGADVRVADEAGNEKAVKELDPGEIERAKKAEQADSPFEKKGQTYYFVGLRYRGMLIPKFMMTLFGDGGASVYVNGLGPEVTIRRDNFEYVLSAWWAGYNMDWTTFKATNDPEDAWELVKSEMNVLYFTSDFNWTTQINPVFGLNLGVGAGLGAVWGDLFRKQAYLDTTTGEYEPCSAANNPATTAGYCGDDNNHYGNYSEPSWFDSGSKPVIFPWFALQTGIRLKPHKNFMARIDAGWAITGPFFGISGNYGI